MSILKNGKYLCGYCLKPYDKPFDAEACKDSHELIYVPLSKADLNRLINFIYSKNDSYLNENLVNILKRYMKGT